MNLPKTLKDGVSVLQAIGARVRKGLDYADTAYIQPLEAHRSVPMRLPQLGGVVSDVEETANSYKVLFHSHDSRSHGLQIQKDRATDGFNRLVRPGAYIILDVTTDKTPRAAKAEVGGIDVFK